MEVERGNATTTTPPPPPVKQGVTMGKDYVSYGAIGLMVVALIAFLINAEYKRMQSENRMAASEVEKAEMKREVQQLTADLERVTRTLVEEERARRDTEGERRVARVRRDAFALFLRETAWRSA